MKCKTLLLFWIGASCAMAQIPENLRPPAGQKLILAARGVGDQIYSCQAAAEHFAWTLKAPDAPLLSDRGEVLGRHFTGPTWELKDGSSVVGKVAASVPSPDPGSVPWLLLNAVGHGGNGTLSGVLTIQRFKTKGGKAPVSGCDSQHAGAELRVPYEADYYFYGRAR